MAPSSNYQEQMQQPGREGLGDSGASESILGVLATPGGVARSLLCAANKYLPWVPGIGACESLFSPPASLLLSRFYLLERGPES